MKQISLAMFAAAVVLLGLIGPYLFPQDHRVDDGELLSPTFKICKI